MSEDISRPSTHASTRDGVWVELLVGGGNARNCRQPKMFITLGGQAESRHSTHQLLSQAARGS